MLTLDLQADATACEVIACLLQFPLDVVPGVSPSFEDANLQDQSAAEWEAMVGLVNVLVSRPRWLDCIIRVWAKVGDEKWQNVKP